MTCSRALASSLAAILLLAACNRVTPKTAPAPDAAAPAASAPEATPATPVVSAVPAIETTPPAVGDRLVGASRTAGGRDLSTSDPRAILTEMIFFDYDQAELLPDARATLDAKLAVLQANPSVRLRIAGHTDERGSDEYNLALGLRRAAAAKRYLVDLGIAEDRIAVVSIGEERPLNAEVTEAAWAQNRRDEFEIIAGGAAVGPR
ncbi:MAG: hypothetical protein RLZZ63_699 [Gemmatimonadota bacterium]|jgi:peptidoglycan-associated lipoprotein